MSQYLTYLPSLLDGAKTTLAFCFVSMPLALVAGLIVYLLDTSPLKPLNVLVYMFKDSAVLSLITVTELTTNARSLAVRHQSDYLTVFLLAAVIYLIISYPISRLSRLAERRLRARL